MLVQEIPNQNIGFFLYLTVVVPSWKVTPDSISQFSALSLFWGSAFWSLLSWSLRKKRSCSSRGRKKRKWFWQVVYVHLFTHFYFIYVESSWNTLKNFRTQQKHLLVSELTLLLQKKIKSLSCTSSLITYLCPCSFSFLSFEITVFLKWASFDGYEVIYAIYSAVKM